jgi:predicted transcriptional regulator
MQLEETAMTSTNIKQAAHKLLDSLPETVTWDDLAYEVEVRASIERGLEDAEAGRTVSHEEVLKQFGLKE